MIVLLSLMSKLYYTFRPLIPKPIKIFARRQCIRINLLRHKNNWRIKQNAAILPQNWNGWPMCKKFALILTHDVESIIGHERATQLAKLEMKLGFRSSFNFVPEDYVVSSELRRYLSKEGFEVGVHGDTHDGKLFFSKSIFMKRAQQINEYLRGWDAVGFRAPAMHHNLDWICHLDIQYDASTFDTDPFEPQSDGMNTIFPFWVQGVDWDRGYVELPYTLPQDFTLFILLKEKNIDIWKRKLNWIAQHGGMALLISHSDYMNFGDHEKNRTSYPAAYYEQFLDYIKEKYADQYWHVLPREIAEFWKRIYQY